ncbi:hypothetical protein FNV43_RR27003 [Rhamnella rubrinervis]|uniref:DNL-type domain-containing protein n=1 Tax=Rhamnella rubrinervis TaxID=2594499 RepID=A0A8K0GN24_9ROSA|nr:hypothetical protein FNV43_RR27003 [Rhamnella rubrinervis]
MAATASTCRLSTACSSSFTFTTHTKRPMNSLTLFNSCKPFPASKTIPTISLSLTRSKVLHTKTVPSKRVCKVLAVSGLANGDSETHPESITSDSKEDATIDIKLPRRSLLVLFTCDSCGERTKRLVNRLAYERGLVFVQDNHAYVVLMPGYAKIAL